LSGARKLGGVEPRRSSSFAKRITHRASSDAPQRATENDAPSARKLAEMRLQMTEE
jgi:hypothetical protein